MPYALIETFTSHLKLTVVTSFTLSFVDKPSINLTV